MDEKDGDETALFTKNEQLQYTGMLWRLKNAPETFQRTVVVILASVKGQYVWLHLLSFIMFSDLLSDPIGHVQTVLNLIKNSKMTFELNVPSLIQRYWLSWACRHIWENGGDY